MAYLNIDNLYKNQDVLLFKELYALEKIHGTSAHVRWKDELLGFFSGGEKHENFVKLFDQEKLTKAFRELGHGEVVVFGEAYGGKCQGMSDTYGKKLRFIVFDVKIGKSWLSVPDMDSVATSLGFEVVKWRKIPADMGAIQALLMSPSDQAQRNGVEEPRKQEGLVLRPLVELRTSNGKRVIAKHKHPDFRETKRKRKVDDPEKLAVLREADAVAEEWVTEMRLTHVTDRVIRELHKEPGIEDTGLIIRYMVEDVRREGEGEFTDTKAVRKAIGQRAAKMWKQRLQNKLYEN